MAKGLTPTEQFAVLIVVVWLLDIAAAYWLNFPFAYCWFWTGIWSHVLHPIASLAILASAIAFFFALAFSKAKLAIEAAVFMLVIGGADGFARALLTLPRNSCG